MKQPDACVVRITDAHGETQGTGFIVSTDALIVTCAHVVEGTEPCVAFPGGEPRPTQVVATDEVHDVAILRLEGELPEEAEPARLGRSAGAYHRDFWSRGYRPLGEMEGIPAEGRVLHAVSECPGADHMPLILKSQDIRKGMSGAPVYIPKLDLVVGMITGYWDSLKPETRILGVDPAFATPAETIAALCPDIQLLEPSLALSPLQRLYISPEFSPESVFKRVRLDRFAGRQWLIDKVDNFLETEERGYFVLEAGAGLGKTTLLAYLVQQRGYIHHFVGFPPDLGDSTAGQKHLAAQLARVWDLDPSLVEALLSDPAPRLDILGMLLADAARRRDETRPDEKIVLVVDAVDKVTGLSGQNVLGLPHVLPRGVYVIVSQRPVQVALRVETTRRVVRLEAEQTENLEDMRVYLQAASKRQGVREALREGGYTATQFVTALLEKCRGVWVYLHHVVEEIECGQRSPLDLAALPHGLWRYYAEHWKRWRDQDQRKWHDIYLPLLAALAAAQEAASTERLAEWAKVKIPDSQLYHLLHDEWAPFLVVAGQGHQARYSLYPAALRDFFEGRVDRENLIWDEESLIDEVTEATHRAHHHLVDRYLSHWGSLEAGLPGLADPAQRDLDEGYGVRHLGTHLAATDRNEKLHLLLAAQTSNLRNAWYEAKLAVGDLTGYIADVTRAMQLAHQEGPRSIGRQIRYALICSSLRLPALSADWLIALVAQRVWDASTALDHVQEIAEPKQRAETLAALSVGFAHRGLEVESLQAANEAWIALNEVEKEKDRAVALYTLIPHLPNEVIGQAVELARGWKNPQRRAELLIALQLRLGQEGPADLTREIMEAIQQVEPLTVCVTAPPQRQILARPHFTTGLAVWLHRPRENEEWTVESLKRLRQGSPTLPDIVELLQHLPLLPREVVPEVLIEVLASVRKLHNDELCAIALITALGWVGLHEEGRPRIADECWSTVRSLRSRTVRLLFCLSLASVVEAYPSMPRTLRVLNWLLRRLKLERKLAWHFAYQRSVSIAIPNKVQLLWELAQSLPTVEERLDVLLRALEAAEAINDPSVRAALLAGLALKLPQEHYQEILNWAVAAAGQVTDETDRAQVLADLAPVANSTGRQDIVGEALDAARSLNDPYIRATVLAQLLPYLEERERLKATQDIRWAAQEIGPGEDYYRSDSLLRLASMLTVPADWEATLKEALRYARELQDSIDRTELLARAITLAPSPEQQRTLFQEAYLAAMSIADAAIRARFLVALAQLLSDSEQAAFLIQHWDELQFLEVPVSSEPAGFACIGPMETPLRDANDALWLRAKILAQLPPELLLSQVEAPRVIGSIYNKVGYADVSGGHLFVTHVPADARSRLLARLLPHMSSDMSKHVLERVWPVAESKDPAKLTSAQVVLMPLVPEHKRRAAQSRARAFARDILNPLARAEALAALARSLTGRNRDAVLSEALSAAAYVGGRDRYLIPVFTSLVPQLSPRLLDRALDIALAMRDDIARAEVLTELACSATEPRRSAIASKAWSEVQRIVVKPDLSEHSQAIENAYICADLLSRLARLASEQDRERKLADALEATFEIADSPSTYITTEWITVGPFTPSFDFTIGLLQTKAWRLGHTRARVVFSSAGPKPYLRFVLFQTEKQTAEKTEPREYGKIEIGKLLEHQPLSEPSIPSILGLGTERGHVRVWISLLGEFSHRLYTRSILLSRLCPFLSPSLLAKGLEMAEAVDGASGRVEAVAALAPHLPQEESVEVLLKALELAQSIDNYANRVEALLFLVPRLPYDYRRQAYSLTLDATALVESPNKRTIYLAKLASETPSKLAERTWRAFELSALMWAERYDEGTLAALVPFWPHMPSETRDRLLVKILTTAAGRPRSQLLGSLDTLSTAIPLVGGQEAADETVDAVLDILKWWP